ncbi:phosphatase PAP2 family protein [Sphingomonas parva]|nr:phosphatase PAP2 family protein [Sphingomonas parva]
MPKLEDAAEPLLAADVEVVEAVQPIRDNPVFERLADLGDEPQLRILCAATMALGAFQQDRRLVLAGARMLAAHTLATFAKDFVKHRIDRTRPRSLGRAETDHRLAPGRSRAKEESSFPSGHAAGAAAVARAFARAFPEAAAPAYAAGGVLAAAQIPRCAHYPTDVGAGLAIGIAAEAALDAGLALAAKALRPSSPEVPPLAFPIVLPLPPGT